MENAAGYAAWLVANEPVYDKLTEEDAPLRHHKKALSTYLHRFEELAEEVSKKRAESQEKKGQENV